MAWMRCVQLSGCAGTYRPSTHAQRPQHDRMNFRIKGGKIRMQLLNCKFYL